jgi:hypothetical protein
MRTLTTLIVASLLGGCSPTVLDTSCSAFRVIPYHGGTDSPDTVARIREHNAAWRRLCDQ